MSAAVVRIQAMYRGWAVRRAMARAKVNLLKLYVYCFELTLSNDTTGQELQEGQKEIVKVAPRLVVELIDDWIDDLWLDSSNFKCLSRSVDLMLHKIHDEWSILRFPVQTATSSNPMSWFSQLASSEGATAFSGFIKNLEDKIDKVLEIPPSGQGPPAASSTNSQGTVQSARPLWLTGDHWLTRNDVQRNLLLLQRRLPSRPCLDSLPRSRQALRRQHLHCPKQQL